MTAQVKATPRNTRDQRGKALTFPLYRNSYFEVLDSAMILVAPLVARRSA